MVTGIAQNRTMAACPTLPRPALLLVLVPLLLWGLLQCPQAAASPPSGSFAPQAPAAVARAAEKLGSQPETALAEALRLIAERDDGADQLHAMLLAAYAHLILRDSDQAIALLQEAVTLARRLEQAELLLLSLDQLATAQIDAIDFDASERVLDEMAALAGGRGLPYWLARERHLRAVRLRRMGDGQGALRLHEEALEIRQRIGDRVGMVESLNAVAIQRRRAGELYQALDHHTRALGLARELELDRDAARTLGWIARIYAALDDDEPAMDFFRQALDALPESEILERAELLRDLSGLHMRLGDLDAAEQLNEDSIRLVMAIGGEKLAVDSFLRRATLLGLRGRPEDGLRWVDRAIEIGREFDGARSVLSRRLTRLRLLEQMERWTEAVPEAAELLAMARASGDRLIERDVLEIQSAVLFGAGNAHGAFLAMSAYSELNASLATSHASRRIADLEANMERRALEANLTLLERDRDLSALRAERQQLWTIGISIAALALMLTILSLRSRMRAVRQVNHLLAERAEQLRIAASTDALTGLINRHGALPWLAALEREHGHPVATLVLDVDHFKQINDGHGHDVGDLVLQALATRLQTALPAGWHLARWGGEEFLAFGRVDDESHATAVAERLRDSIRKEAVAAGELSVGVTASIGVAVRPAARRAEWDTLLKAADEALYRAKNGGRDRVELAAQTATA
jgi:diguanylate cyclase (GGDEF)-like protein